MTNAPVKEVSGYDRRRLHPDVSIPDDPDLGTAAPAHRLADGAYRGWRRRDDKPARRWVRRCSSRLSSADCRGVVRYLGGPAGVSRHDDQPARRWVRRRTARLARDD